MLPLHSQPLFYYHSKKEQSFSVLFVKIIEASTPCKALPLFSLK